MLKIGISIAVVLLLGIQDTWGQRRLPAKSKEQKTVERQIRKRGKQAEQPVTEQRWDPRKIPAKSKGLPEISAWHAGTAGVIASDQAEISLIQVTRIGFTAKTELLFRIAEEPFLPNIGLKHKWWANRRFALATGHSLYYTYPGLKLLQNSGFKDLVPDSVKVRHGIAMRHEVLFSWLMNPRVWGCPDPPSEKILSLRAGSEFYLGAGDPEVKPFDYAHLLYHTQLLDKKVLWYGGLQFDSYFANRFHYTLNGLFYSVDLQKDYAIEANLRLTYYLSRHWGISLAAKGSCLNIAGQKKFVCLPLLDLTYLVNPGRSTIKHGLSRRRKRG